MSQCLMWEDWIATLKVKVSIKVWPLSPPPLPSLIKVFELYSFFATKLWVMTYHLSWSSMQMLSSWSQSLWRFSMPWAYNKSHIVGGGGSVVSVNITRCVLSRGMIVSSLASFSSFTMCLYFTTNSLKLSTSSTSRLPRLCGWATLAQVAPPSWTTL